jgi:hypothetical protein
MSFLSRCFFVFTILILLSGHAAAQDTPADEAQPLNFGETVTGTLDDNHYEDRWTFTGERGDRISLIMTRSEDQPGGLDGYMLLIGPDGETLEQIDDTGSDVMPSLTDYDLPADGTYTVVATRFGFQNGFSTGSYTLSLNKLSDEETDGGGAQWISEDNLPADLRALSYNERSIGTISNEDFEDWYMFRGRGGDVITVRMTADNSELDSYLILLDNSGLELASNDDADDSTEAVIADFELPTDGNYLIRATRYGYNNGPSSGDYTISIETDAEGVTPAEGSETPRALAFGESVSHSLDLDNIHDLYSFSGSAGQIITVAVRRLSGDLDPALSLRGPDQNEIALNRDQGIPSEARLTHITLPQTGEYTIDVMLEDLNSSGDYQVLLLSGSGEILTSDWQPTGDTGLEFALSWDSDIDLDLSVTDSAGEIINVTHPASGNSGEIGTTGNNFCANLEPEPTELIIWRTPQPGIYQIAVTYQFNCAGLVEPVPFTLTIADQGEIVAVLSGSLAREGDVYLTTYTAP